MATIRYYLGAIFLTLVFIGSIPFVLIFLIGALILDCVARFVVGRR